jgi:hypothetical protein
MLGKVSYLFFLIFYFVKSSKIEDQFSNAFKSFSKLAESPFLPPLPPQREDVINVIDPMDLAHSVGDIFANNDADGKKNKMLRPKNISLLQLNG